MPLTIHYKTLLLSLSLAAGLSQAAEFKVFTDSQVDGRFPAAQFANGFGCQGGNQSPHITWQGAPEGTKSFTVTLYDPDAPTGSGWWHWAVANIPGDVSELPAGAGNQAARLPKGALPINNDASEPVYGGVCPPVGQTHRYIVTVHALKVEKLALPSNATPALLGYMSWLNSLGSAQTSVLAGR